MSLNPLKAAVAVCALCLALPAAAAGAADGALALGVAAVESGELDAAAQHFGAAIAAAAAQGDADALVRGHLNAARLSWQRRDAATALTHVRAARAVLVERPDSRDTVTLLINAGTALRADPGAAGERYWDRRGSLEALTAARAMAERLGDRRGRGWASGFLAGLYLADARPADAIVWADRAIFDAQAIGASDQLLRWYRTRARAERARGRPAAAAADYRHALTHLSAVRDALAAGPDGAASFRTVVGPLYREFADVLLSEAAASDGARRATLLDETVTAIEALRTAELADYFLDDCVVAAQARANAGRRAGDGVAILYPVLLAERTDLILRRGETLTVHSVAAGADAVAVEARALRRALQSPGSEAYLAPARRLHGWLLEPLHEALTEARIETLVVIADGVLRTIPFAALHDGERFAVERYALATTPGLSMTEVAPLPPQVNALVSGLSEAVAPFPPLPAVEAELDAMTALLGPERVRVLRNRDFTSARLEEELARTPFHVVHIASHGVFRGAARDSFVLAWDGPVSMDRLERLMGYGRFSDGQIELLTLSACETAVGDERAALGLSGVAIKAGARSAVGSLWQVGDEATAAMIGSFYRHLLEPGTTRARALQAAQRDLLRGERYAHPWAWSPFLLIGSWL